MKVKIQVLNGTEVFVRIPQEVMKEMEWKEGDTLNMEPSMIHPRVLIMDKVEGWFEGR